MSESYGDPQKGKNFNGARGGSRGGRGPSNREGGGFRIRLSDNEMRASRAIQEAFNLRSTVSVLGFALRTLGQMLEEGKLDSLISEYKTQNSHSNTDRDKYESRGKRSDNINKANIKPDPFARPAKPENIQPEENIDKKDNEVINTDEANDPITVENTTKEEKQDNQTNESN